MKGEDKIEGLKIIGRTEWCTFNELGIPAISARIDSGAKTSSIQATEIELSTEDDIDWVEFDVHPLRKHTDVVIRCKCKIFDQRSIKGSFGISEERIIIKTPVIIGEETFEIELSLANRNTMEYKMLLGREAISERFLINPADRNVQGTFSKKSIAAKYDLPFQPNS